MKTMFRTFTFCFVLAIVALALTTPSFAGSQTGYTGTIAAGGIDFTATLIMNSSNDTFTLDFTGQNTNLTTATLNLFALQLFCCGSNGNFDLTSSSLPVNWTDEAGAKINNSGSLGCNASNGAAGWLCATAESNPAILLIASGQKFDMSFSGTYGNGTTANSMFDLMANGLTNSDDSHSKWSVSQSFSWTEFTPVPEPGSLAILGSGLFSLGMLLRKKMLL